MLGRLAYLRTRKRTHVHAHTQTNTHETTRTRTHIDYALADLAAGVAGQY